MHGQYFIADVQQFRTTIPANRFQNQFQVFFIICKDGNVTHYLACTFVEQLNAAHITPYCRDGTQKTSKCTDLMGIDHPDDPQDFIFPTHIHLW